MKVVFGQGCWFCREDDEKEYLSFDSEFDTKVHLSCIRKALEDTKNREAAMMAYLLENE